MTNKDQAIVFIGFMGVGKTTVGKELAKKLSRNFVDIDEVIENEFNMPATEIFKTFGEKAFREKEKSIITNFSKQKHNIISLGGGAFLQDEIREVCLSNCHVIFLEMSWELWVNRVPFIIDTRPVLQGKTMDEMKELFYKRHKSYSTYHLKVLVDHMTPEDAANYIIETLELK